MIVIKMQYTIRQYCCIIICSLFIFLPNYFIEGATRKSVGNCYEQSLKEEIPERRLKNNSEQSLNEENIKKDLKTVKIRGIIVDTEGEPIAGVDIFESATKVRVSTTSDLDGKFQMDCPITVKKLKVTMLGFKSETIKIEKKESMYLKIVLENDFQNLSDVVITGYVEKKKESNTGAIYEIKKDEIEKLVNTNVLSIIKLKSPGFELKEDVNIGADPNKIPEMILRGRSSFIEGNETNTPLFILDGTEVDISRVFNLPSEDIENITILKDASATAFYGSKAANGVVVITTVPAKKGGLTFTYSGHTQTSFVDMSGYNLLNAKEKLEYERLAGVYGNLEGTTKPEIEKQKDYYAKLKQVNAGVNTKWHKQALRTGVNHIHHLSMAGGSKNFRYRASANVKYVMGIMDKSSRKNTSARINFGYGGFDNLFITNNAEFTHSSSSDVPYGNFYDYLKLNPYDKPRNPDGSLNSRLSFGQTNPLFEKELNSYIHHSTDYFTNSLRLRWKLSPALRIEGSVGYNLSIKSDETFTSPLSNKFFYADPMKRGSFRISDLRRSSTNGNIFLVWNKNFGKDLGNLLNITTGANIENSHSNSHTTHTLGVLTDKHEHPSMSIKYDDRSHPGGGEHVSRMLGTYINANCIIKNKYFADASFRYEGSSKFGSGNKLAPFGSIGFGWNVHNENWLKDSFITHLKLRVNAGFTGNASFNPYQAKLSYIYTPDLFYDGRVGAIPYSMINTHLKWEKTFQRSAGLDFGFFKDKFSGSLDFYSNTTNNLIMSIAKPPRIGFSNATENLGKIRNTGIELSLRGNIFHSYDSNINLFLNIGHNRNRIVHISENLKNKNKENEDSNKNKYLPVNLYEEGESMTALKVMQSAGINPENGREVYIRRDGKYTYEYDYREKITVGDTTPKIQGAFGLSANWKEWDFSMTISYRLGATLYNQTLASKIEGANPIYNADKRVFYNRWKGPGDESFFKGIADRTATLPTDRFVQTEYMLNCSSARLAYTIPSLKIKNSKIRNLRFSLSAGDIFRFSSIKRERGLNYPYAHTVEFSMSFNFR